MDKTNCCRILDRHGINYRLLKYEIDENALDAVTVADKLGLPHEQVFKTLVFKGDKTGYFTVLIPAGREVIPKKAASVSGNKSCSILPLKELFPLTGYIRGGCSVIGMKKSFPVYIDISAGLFDEICISPGKRGLQIMVNPDSICNITNGR
ncbi:MAG: Cys-tRNA(Pro) deacylase, partial [Spirochaetes bacterium]|nr:Cys-tRNA(Pro) deacylase [Spirochaetota bacterium]